MERRADRWRSEVRGTRIIPRSVGNTELPDAEQARRRALGLGVGLRELRLHVRRDGVGNVVMSRGQRLPSSLGNGQVGNLIVIAELPVRVDLESGAQAQG